MDLKQHLIRQMAWSHAAFGPGERMEGVIDHLRKELVEIEESNGDSSEWVDAAILALDGLTRRLAFSTSDNQRKDPAIVAQMACNMIEGKQTRNEARTWPDWRTADRNKAIEHDRTGENDGSELEALRKLYIAVTALRKTSPVDNDFPEMMHNVDREVARCHEFSRG